MATIGVINLLMRANSAPFSKDIGKAKDSIKDLKNEAASGGGVLNKFAGSMSGLGTVIAGVGAAIGAAVIAKSLYDLTSESMKTVAATGKLSDRLGVTTEDLIGLQHAARMTMGADQVDSFNDALGEMQKKIGEISAEDGGQKAILQSLGLDGKKMAGQGAVENLGQIADAISKVESRAEKLDLVDKIFGGAGAGLLPLLEQGSAAINEYTADAENLGLMFSNVDAEKVNQANQVMTKLGEIIQGTGQQLAIGLAPYITAAAQAFEDLGLQGWDVAGIISAGMKWIGAGVGVVLDVVHTLKIGWKYLQAGATAAIALILDSVATLGEGLEYLLNLIPGVSVEFGTMARDMAEEVSELADTHFKEAMDALAAPPPSVGINKFFDDIETNAQRVAEEITNAKKPVDALGESFLNVTKKVGDLEKKLKEQIATFGLSSEQVEIYKLKQEGASASQIASVKSLSEELAKLEEKKKLEDDLNSKAKSLLESTKTPLEKYQTEIKELQQMLSMGLIDQKTFDRATKKAGGELNGENRFGGSALKVGSDEGRMAILKFRGLDRRDPNIGVEKNTLVVASESKKQTALLEKALKQLETDNSYAFN